MTKIVEVAFVMEGEPPVGMDLVRGLFDGLPKEWFDPEAGDGWHVVAILATDVPPGGQDEREPLEPESSSGSGGQTAGSESGASGAAGPAPLPDR